MLAFQMALVRQVSLVRSVPTSTPSSMLAVRHVCVWNLTGMNAKRHQAHWAICFAATHALVWGLSLARVQQLPYIDLRRHTRTLNAAYGDRIVLRSVLRAAYTEQVVARSRLRLPYTNRAVVSVGFRTPYADKVILRSSLSLAYGLLASNDTRFAAGYALLVNNAVNKRHTLTWSLLRNQAIQSVVNTPVMRWQALTLSIIQARLSCDEDSPVWIAGIELAHLADFAAIAIGDRITLQLGAETFALVVDGKTLSRESQSRQRCELTAISPLALLDSPFAATIRFYQAEAVMAHAAVEALIGAVDWQLPDWRIPAGRLLMEGVTPLAAARSLVASIGGIVESQPYGTVICRRRHPVRIPEYGQATVAHALFDGDVLASRAQIAPARGFNRVTLANEESASTASSDRIEYVVDPENANQGTLRVYLALARPVLLTHTGHPQTVIAALGNVTRQEHEVVEFIEGRASTRYPVTALERADWQHADLGTVKAEAMSLVSTVPGYSLLDLVYTTTSLDWRVALAADEEVQFILIDV